MLIDDTFKKVAFWSKFLITNDNRLYDVREREFVDIGIKNVIDLISVKPRVVIVRQD